MKILNIIETAYRATIEEQDDTTVWISHALKGAGADLDVLLQGNAVNYVVASQTVSGLKIGNCKQTQPADLVKSLNDLIDKGCKVFVISEDLDERGIESGTMIEGVNIMGRSDLAGCLDQYHQVWQW